MRLLLDQNLSRKLCLRLNDIFPGSAQVRMLGLDQAEDRVIWTLAESDGSIIVTHDKDFAIMATLSGPPPKVIRLVCGNQPTAYIEQLLRQSLDVIETFYASKTTACLELPLRNSIA